MKDLDKKDGKKDEDKKDDNKDDDKRDDKKEDKKDVKKEEEKKMIRMVLCMKSVDQIYGNQEAVDVNTENGRMERTQVSNRRRSPSRPLFIRRTSYNFENSSLSTDGNLIINSLRAFARSLRVSKTQSQRRRKRSTLER